MKNKHFFSLNYAVLTVFLVCSTFSFSHGPGSLVTETPPCKIRYFAKYILFGFFRLAKCQNMQMASPKFSYYGKPTHGDTGERGAAA